MTRTRDKNGKKVIKNMESLCENLM